VSSRSPRQVHRAPFERAPVAAGARQHPQPCAIARSSPHEIGPHEPGAAGDGGRSRPGVRRRGLRALAHRGEGPPGGLAQARARGQSRGRGTVSASARTAAACRRCDQLDELQRHALVRAVRHPHAPRASGNPPPPRAPGSRRTPCPPPTGPVLAKERRLGRAVATTSLDVTSVPPRAEPPSSLAAGAAGRHVERSRWPSTLSGRTRSPALKIGREAPQRRSRSRR